MSNEIAVLLNPSAVASPIRSTADHQADRIARFVARHPQYGRLAPDVLLQYADTYRDDADHALEQEFRDNGVLRGCRADYKRPGTEEGSDYLPDAAPYYGYWEAF